MTKILVDLYYSYGKGDGEELGDRLLVDNTPEGRKEVFDCFHYDESYDGSEEGFISGEDDYFSFASFGGDWDEPTGGYIVANTEEQLIKQAKKRMEEEITEVKHLFKMK